MKYISFTETFMDFYLLGALHPVKCATDRVTNPHLQFGISYSCTVNPAMVSLIPHIDLT